MAWQRQWPDYVLTFLLPGDTHIHTCTHTHMHVCAHTLREDTRSSGHAQGGIPGSFPGSFLWCSSEKKDVSVWLGHDIVKLADLDHASILEAVNSTLCILPVMFSAMAYRTMTVLFCYRTKTVLCSAGRSVWNRKPMLGWQDVFCHDNCTQSCWRCSISQTIQSELPQLAPACTGLEIN